MKILKHLFSILVLTPLLLSCGGHKSAESDYEDDDTEESSKDVFIVSQIGAHDNGKGIMDANGHFYADSIALKYSDTDFIVVDGVCFPPAIYKEPTDTSEWPAPTLFTVSKLGDIKPLITGLYSAGYLTEGLIPTCLPNQPIIYRDRDGRAIYKIEEVNGKKVTKVGSFFKEGVSWYCDEDGHIGLLNSQGKIIAEAKYGHGTNGTTLPMAAYGLIGIPNGEEMVIYDTGGNELFILPDCMAVEITENDIRAIRYALGEEGGDIAVYKIYSHQGQPQSNKKIDGKYDTHNTGKLMTMTIYGSMYVVNECGMDSWYEFLTFIQRIANPFILDKAFLSLSKDFHFDFIAAVLEVVTSDGDRCFSNLAPFTINGRKVRENIDKIPAFKL